MASRQSQAEGNGGTGRPGGKRNRWSKFKNLISSKTVPATSFQNSGSTFSVSQARTNNAAEVAASHNRPGPYQVSTQDSVQEDADRTSATQQDVSHNSHEPKEATLETNSHKSSSQQETLAWEAHGRMTEPQKRSAPVEQPNQDHVIDGLTSLPEPHTKNVVFSSHLPPGAAGSNEERDENMRDSAAMTVPRLQHRPDSNGVNPQDPRTEVVLEPESPDVPWLIRRAPTADQNGTMQVPTGSSPKKSTSREVSQNRSASKRALSPLRQSVRSSPDFPIDSLTKTAGIIAQPTTKSTDLNEARVSPEEKSPGKQKTDQDFKWSDKVWCSLEVTLDGREVQVKDIPIVWTEKGTYQTLWEHVENSTRDANFADGYDHLDLSRDCYLQSGSFHLSDDPYTSSQQYDGAEKFSNLACAVAGFIYHFPYKPIRVHIKWALASNGIPPDVSVEYVDAVRNEMAKSVEYNFDRKPYIPRSKVLHMLARYTSGRIIDEDLSLKTKTYSLSLEELDHFKDKVQLWARRLQALCVYRRLPMRFLKELLEIPDEADTSQIISGYGRAPYFGDDNPPTKKTAYPFSHQRWLAEWQNLKEFQPSLFAYRFGEVSDDTDEFEMPADIILPIRFEDELAGQGTFSKVFRAHIHPDHHFFTADRTKVFALKQLTALPFQSETQRKAKFDQECGVLKVLQNIRKADSQHINLHYSAWTQRNDDDETTFNILLPLADTDLVEFMNQVPTVPPFPAANFNGRHVAMSIDSDIHRRPLLDRDFVEWLLQQLSGLAKALHSLHAIPFEKQDANNTNLDAPRPKHGATAFHHDIKSSNILVFLDNKSKYGTLKFSDFGSGAVKEDVDVAATYRLSRPTPLESTKADGTIMYEAPDRWLNGSHSRKADIWSLGCVFLEVLMWCLHPIRQSRKSLPSRCFEIAQGRNPREATDAFWIMVGNDQTTPEAPKEMRKAAVNPAVEKMLENLEGNHCRGKPAFKQLLKTTRQMLTVETDARRQPDETKRRMTVYKLTSDLDQIVSNAQKQLKENPTRYCEADENFSVEEDIIAPISPSTYPAPDLADEPERHPLTHHESLLGYPKISRSPSMTRRDRAEVLPPVDQTLFTDPAASSTVTNEDILGGISSNGASQRTGDVRIYGASSEREHHNRSPTRSHTHPPVSGQRYHS